MNRRDFLKWVGGGSGALLAGCAKREPEKIVSYVTAPHEAWIPGLPVYAPSTCMECPAQCGIQVKSYEKFQDGVGRMMPLKVEGIKGHPINDGTLCLRGQAGITRLYQEQRLKKPLLKDKLGNVSEVDWAVALKRVQEGLKGKGTHVWLSGRTTGSLSELIARFCAEAKVERAKEYEPFPHAEIRKANEIVFGKPEIPLYKIENADFLLTIGADILETFVSPVSHAVQLERAKKKHSLRWVHAEPHLSLTGAKAPERLVLAPRSEVALLAYLLRNVPSFGKLDKDVVAAVPVWNKEETAERTGIDEKELDRLVKHLAEARRPLVIVGGVSTAHSAGTAAAVLAALLQHCTGMAESTVDFSQSEDYANVGSVEDAKKLADRLKAGEVGVLFLSRTNPVAALPATAGFAEGMKRAALRVALTDFSDETARECDVVLPLSHALESWGDAHPRKGVREILRPVVAPMYDTRTEGEILLRLLGSKEEYAATFRNLPKEALEIGYVLEPVKAESLGTPKADDLAKCLRAGKNQPRVENLTLVLAPSVRTFDGRSARLPLVNEIPDPLTTITYGSWVSVSPSLAKEMSLEDGDEVSLESTQWTGKLPAKIQPLLPAKVLTVARGVIDSQVASTGYVENVRIAKTGGRTRLPILSGSPSQEGRGLIPGQHAEEEHGKEEHGHGAGNGLYPAHHHHPYRWAMAIDLDACTGCGACVAACYVENNVPIVGPVDHVKGREMSWIRIEPFYEEEKVGFLPMMCQHCDNGPCEPVCPVFASYHNPEGLNAQVYNRCVGTRYCSNNCPYKVRRFNWWENSGKMPLGTMSNPELTVRPRGVMEKCTFCVQRIRTGKDLAKDEGRLVRDGEVTPACAQTCPSSAIVFGNILDPTSRVAHLAQSKRGYKVFEELNAQPAVTYLRPEEHA